MTGVATNDRLLDDALVEQFDRDGFVVVAGLLDDDELDRYGELVTAAVLERTEDDTTPLEEKSRYQQSFVQCMNLWEDHPEVAAAHLPPQARAGRRRAPPGRRRPAVARPGALQAAGRSAAPTPTRTTRTGRCKETASVTAWIPFEGSTLAGGAMAYLPGTHTHRHAQVREHLLRRARGHPGRPRGRRHRAGVRRGARRAAWRSTTGSPCTSPTRTTPTAPRAVHTIIYFADGNTRGYPVPHFSVDRYGIEVGQPIDSEATPIVWPRPDGDLPPVPAVPIHVPNAVVANSGAMPRP